MLRSASQKLCFSPDTNDLPKYSYKGSISSNNSPIAGNRKGFSGLWNFPVTKHSPAGGFSAMRYLQHLGTKVVRAIQLVSLKRKSRRRRYSPKVSSSNSAISSRPTLAPLDSFQADAIEDCIEFIHFSASLQRSNSVPAP